MSRKLWTFCDIFVWIPLFFHYKQAFCIVHRCVSWPITKKVERLKSLQVFPFTQYSLISLIPDFSCFQYFTFFFNTFPNILIFHENPIVPIFPTSIVPSPIFPISLSFIYYQSFISPILQTQPQLQLHLWLRLALVFKCPHYPPNHPWK